MTPPNPALWDPVASRNDEIRDGAGAVAGTAEGDGAEGTLALLRRELARRWPESTDTEAEDGGRDGVDTISRYALLPTGKLLRPLLLVESAAAVGGEAEAEKVVSAALGVEYLHVGSLIHDDVIDGDELRRGRPTVAAHFGTADAIVAGDALILGMFRAVTECAEHGIDAARLLSAVRALADAGVDLCRGQSLEAELCGDAACGLDRYLTMSALKTGALFRGACHSGAVLGGGSPEQQRALRQFAEHLGLAFQMSDDLLPYNSSTATSGKSATSDIANRRPTFPVLVGYELAGETGRARLSAALGGAQPLRNAVRSVREVLEETGALEAAQQRIRTEVERAHDCLRAVPEGRSRDVLASVAELSAGRDR